jgi:hypothetical protein
VPATRFHLFFALASLDDPNRDSAGTNTRISPSRSGLPRARAPGRA